MAIQTVNLGTAPTGAGGDTFRSGSAKLQANDDELYAALGASGGVLPSALPIGKGGTGATTAAAAAHALACIGAGQRLVQKKDLRAVNITYANTTGRVMLVCIRMDAAINGLGGVRLMAYSGPHAVWQSWGAQAKGAAFMMVVENGTAYSLDLIEGSLPPDFSITEWVELIP